MNLVNGEGELRGETTINSEIIQRGAPDRFLNYKVVAGASLIGIAINSHL